MSSRVVAELKPRLSSNAAIFGPHDREFPNLVSRWREYHAPTVTALVQVVTESDIQEAVSKYAYLKIDAFLLFYLLIIISLLDSLCE
jgi:hypothetical protein